MPRIPLILCSMFLLAATVQAAPTCLDAAGEAVIVNNDLPSARAEAVARAKWAAVEKAVGVEVKAQSVVQNLMLVDEAVSRQINGVVSGHRVLGEQRHDDAIEVTINACVEPTRARDAVAGMALNSAIAVFIPARRPGSTEYEETNALSESLIGSLSEQGYTVVDVAPSQAVEASSVENALKSGNFLGLRSLMYRFLTNILLIGKVDYNVTTRKGENVGYGISLPFNNVTARLTYRLLTRDSSGKIVILAAGAEEGKGMAGKVEDAVANGLKDLADRLTPVIQEKIGRHMKGVARRVTVKVNGVSELSDNFAVKELLQNLAWVSQVEEKGLGEFMVSYPENPIYLANSLRQKGSFRVESFSPAAISVFYEKQH
jgi:hypothetical protein